jgi:hypothetical protein
MQFKAECAASISKNGAKYVLLKFEPQGYLMGTIAKELGELKSGRTYKITIEEEGE